MSHTAPLQNDGTFRFHSVAAGDYQVTVSAKIKGDESPKSNYAKVVQIKRATFTEQAVTTGIDVGVLEVEQLPLAY